MKNSERDLAESGTSEGQLQPLVMSDIQYKEIMWAEMSPDIYSGENLDEIRPRWHAFADGDMDSDYIDAVKLDPSHFPPGTKISVSVPCCPKCGQEADMCKNHTEHCDFNWNEWVEGKYS